MNFPSQKDLRVSQSSGDSCTVACLDARFAAQIVRQELVFVIY